jgi:DegV family protein with EDD domain
MSKVAIVTDSVACLPAEQVERYCIKVVSIKIIFGDRVYNNGVDLSTAEAYELLEKAPDHFHTSPSTPADYLGIFNELAAGGQDILCVTVSSKLSTTYNVACLAAQQVRQQYPGCHLEVMDSCNATASQGFVALAAAQAAEQGKDFTEVITTARAVRDRVQLIFAMDTIRHAYRTGRIPKFATQLGSMLGVKPMLTINGGVVHVIGIVRTRNKGVERIINIMKRKAGDQPLHVAVMHTAILPEAEEFRQRIAGEFNCVELLLTEVTPIIGYSIGTGVLGVAFYTTKQTSSAPGICQSRCRH